MIDRYTTREMRELWSPQSKTQRWLDVEIAVCEGLERFGHIPQGTTGAIRESARFELSRIVERVQSAVEMVSVGKVSGAVGTHANIDPRVEEYVCETLGLKPAPVSTQIIARDRHAQFVCMLAILAASLERFATEIRNLQ